jgi:hypothetical protein
MKKRLLAAILAAIMVATFTPTVVFATGDNVSAIGEDESKKSDKVVHISLNPDYNPGPNGTEADITEGDYTLEELTTLLLSSMYGGESPDGLLITLNQDITITANSSTNEDPDLTNMIVLAGVGHVF